MANLYQAVPAGSATNASIAANSVSVANATLKTMLQVVTPSTRPIKLVQWWAEFDSSTANTPIRTEIMRTQASVAASVTSLTPQPYDLSADSPASLCPGGATSTGYNASGEGAFNASSQIYESHLVPPTSGIFVQYPLGREPYVPVSSSLRLRTIGVASLTPNSAVGFIWEE